MRYGGSWMSRGIVVAVFALIGLAALPALEPVDGPAADPGALSSPSLTADPASPADLPLTDFADSLNGCPEENQAQPTAICRLLPECWSNSDCDFRCGVGQGKCVHHNCPPRLCKCS